LMLVLNLLQKFARQCHTFFVTALDFSLSRRRRFILEHLPAQFHLSLIDHRMHADWKIAITVEPTQKFSLCLQTNQRFAIAHRLEKRFCALIIRADLESNDSLTASWDENFVGKNLEKEFLTFKADFGSR